MDKSFERLLSPGYIGKVRTRNRIVMPPMVRNYATTDGIVTQQLIDHYAARARGGVGLIIVEATYVHPSGRVWHQGVGIDDDRCIPGLGQFTDAVHQWGSKVFIQLVHGGRQSTTAVSKLPVLAPSAIPCPVTGSNPREMTTQEVADIIDAFAQAALRAKKCGFDGVELHGAHGYLMSQFFSARTNRRTDKYGGDINGRATIAVETIKKIRQLVGNDYPVTIRINGEDRLEGGQTIGDSKALARILETAGVNAIHVTLGMAEANLDPRFVATVATMLSPRGHILDYAAEIKSVVKVPVIAVGSLSPEMAEKALGEGKADFIAIGRGLLADPDLPKKLERGERERIRPCIRCNEMCMGRVPLGIRCTVNTEVGYEGQTLIPALRPKNVFVIGGGAAGMEAARIAAMRGHRVTLYEKNAELGGHMVEASIPKFKQDVGAFKDWLIKQMGEIGVKVELGKEATSELIEKTKPDVVIVSTGAHPLRPNIPGIDNPVVATAIDILNGKTTSGNHPIIAGAGAVGSELALFLAQQGKDVTLVEMLPQIASDVAPVRNALTCQLGDYRVKVRTECKIVAIDNDGVMVINQSQNLESIKGDRVILALGMVPDNSFYEAIRGKVREAYAIGDSVEPRRIGEAVHEGYRVASVI